jgi:hypothetical protein
LNLRAQSIGLGSQWISQLDNVEFTERFAQAAGIAEGPRTIEATLAVTYDRERIQRRRIGGANLNRRLSQPRRRTERTQQDEGGDGNTGGARGEPIRTPIC